MNPRRSTYRPLTIATRIRLRRVDILASLAMGGLLAWPLSAWILGS